MSKTPEEMAEEYTRYWWPDYNDVKTCCQTHLATRQAFLAGYKAARQWISVKDRLPDGCDPGGDCDYEIKDYPYVLAYSPTDGIHVAYYDTHRGVFETSATTSAYAEELYKVTYWQLLPAPPKEDK